MTSVPLMFAAGYLTARWGVNFFANKFGNAYEGAFMSGGLLACLFSSVLAATVVRNRRSDVTVGEATIYWFGAALAWGFMGLLLSGVITFANLLLGTALVVLSTILFRRWWMSRHPQRV